MTPSDLIDRFRELHPTEKLVLAILALVGPTPNKTRLASYLSKGGFRSPARLAYTSTTLDHLLTTLTKAGLVEKTPTGEWRSASASAIQASALRVAMENGTFAKICDAVDAVDQVEFALGRTHPTNAYSTRMMLRMSCHPDRAQPRRESLRTACPSRLGSRTLVAWAPHWHPHGPPLYNPAP